MLDLRSRQSQILADRLASQRLRDVRYVKPLPGMRVILNGLELTNFSSNDYLGLSQHPLLKERAIEWTNRYGTGCGASRLITGTLEVYEALESKLANLKGTESALIMGSGYQTNVSTIAALAQVDKNSFFLSDRLNHNSLLQGVLHGSARWSRFEHNDLNDLRTRLHSERAASASERWIITESVFSMDGDRADIDALLDLRERNGASLYIDEAHSTGLFGPQGMGLAAGKSSIDIIMGTFGKALGSFGSYIACSKIMRDYLVNFSGGIIYSTGLPPSVLAAIDAALDIIPHMDEDRQRLSQVSDLVRKQLHDLGYSTGASTTQIIPIVIGSDQDALDLSKFLEQHGILALAIRPPTVPDGSARVRLSLSSAHTDEQIELLLAALRSWRKCRL
jgi:8-amino-7-oxononanoate synthase